MPEIKHTFTSGKMNKDLDERLIPNGEYRDAMNIQVSTSEGADVGTVQNIMGNSLISGQNNVLTDASCVGSIADEKNDKLYWFITNSDTRIIDLIDQSVFEPNYTRIVNKNMILEYDVSNEIVSPVFVDDIRIAVSAQGGGVYNCPATPLLDMLDVTGIEVGMYVHGIDTSGITIFSSTVTSITLNTSPTPHQVNLADNPCSTFENTMWYIFSWHPNVTDSKGILNFKRGEYITGINIIDDMLFWTDNHSEPKKINISRCKTGTPNFNTQTKLINDSQDIDITSNISTREDHVTVIKKSPPTSPTIELRSERFNTSGKIHTGVMRITESFGWPTVDKTQNLSSFNAITNAGVKIGSTRYDFSGLGVGDTFMTEVETDIDGNSDFTLDWAEGDTVMIKEFEDDSPPSIPITDYRIKTKIIPRASWWNNRFTDSSSEMLLHNGNYTGDFITPKTSGLAPEGWSGVDGAVSYSALDNKLVWDDPNQWKKTYTEDLLGFSADEEYRVTFTLSGVTAGGVTGVIVIPSATAPTTHSRVYSIGYYFTNGTHTENITLASSKADYLGYTSLQDKFYLQAIGNGQVDGYIGRPELVDTSMANSSTLGATRGTHAGGDAWEANPSGIDVTEISFDYTEIDDVAHANAVYSGGGVNHRVIYCNNIMTENLINGARYELDLEVTLVSQAVGFTAFTLGVSSSGGVGGSARFTQADFDSSNTVTKTIEFNSNTSGGKIDLFVKSDTIPTTSAYGGSGREISSVFGVSFSAKINLRKEKGFTGNVENVSVEDLSTNNAKVAFEITDISGIPPQVEAGETELKYALDKQDKEEKLFEFKFPRFAYRYKYEDGEYSAFSPFSQIAFLPGSFDYHPKKGYNLAMTNRIKSIVIKNIDTYIPDDVISIDILYTEENSPNVYLVDTIKPSHWMWEYEITSEVISKILPSNQLLRPWDNVPKKALAQDVVGNRIVYGNYLQGYDLINNADIAYHANFNWDFTANDVMSTTAKSMKSLREYQLGVVFVDEYGRETPVISSQKAAKTMPKRLANKANQINVNFINNDYVKDMKYFKFFVKETSGEYYNLAMDRFWDADDDHVWVSFPSSDRNKIDIDTFLILKKGIADSELVIDPARYKIISIENEAPDFIKTKVSLIEEKTHVLSGANNLFDGTLSDAPLSGRDSFKMNYEPFFNSSGAELHKMDEGTLYVEFTKTGESATSSRYEIASITTDYTDSASLANSKYSIQLDKNLGVDVDFMADDNKILDTSIARIYKYEVKNSPEFDGRFFVKLVKDDVFVNSISDQTTVDLDYRVVTSKKLYYMNGTTHNATHAGTITGQTDGRYDSNFVTPGGNVNYANDFGRFAPFFRNYDSEDTTIEMEHLTLGDTPINQYIFGDTGDARDEFREWTAEWVGWAGQGSQAAASTLKDADKAAGKNGTDDPVWFIDAGNYEGKRGTNDNLHWPWVSQTGGTNFGIYRPSNSSKYSYLNIAMGGIFDSEISGSSNSSISNFFSIGKDNGNENYRDSSTVDLVNQFFPAIKFRFREDPNANIYTIQTGVTYQRLLRYSDGSDSTNYPSPRDPGNSNDNPWENRYDQIAQLSPNFTKNWNLKIQNQNETDTHVVEWDPTEGGSLGPINNGLKLSINHSGDAAPSGILPALAVKVDTLNGTHTDGTTHQIKVGMILTSHSNGTTGHTDGTEANEDWLAIWKIEKIGLLGDDYNIFLTGYSAILPSTHDLYSNAPTASQTLIFEQPAMNGYSEYSANRINASDPNDDGFEISNPGLMAIGYNIDFVEPVRLETDLPTNPAIWETEPKEAVDLDIYYEAGGLNPMHLTDDTKNLAIPIGSEVTHIGSSLIPGGTKITSITSNGVITLSEHVLAGAGYIYYNTTGGDELDRLKITKPDGSSIVCTITDIGAYTSGSVTNEFTINTNLYGSDTAYILGWHNCYSFGNGVESNRIRDNFNLQYISNGVKASTTLEEGDYKEERRKYGLIYSGLYNGISGINNLNQFIQAEKITKDINPIYGSIQKIHTRDTDLVTLCEDKVLRIQANKDALYNADGNPQLIATNRVLGQTIPFVGEFGISKNPESFVSEAYRSYFTDKQRGAVMRLSKDGLTPISMHGMKDWFRDNLKLYDELIGSYDDRNDEYNLTLRQAISVPPKTVSFKEDVKGWVSFKSFTPESAISCANDYFTILEGKLYKHYDESIYTYSARNTFYNNFEESSVTVILNDQPGSVKSFYTLDYEGSQSRVEGIRTIEVTGIDYHGGTNDGRYFFFEESEVNSFFNQSDSTVWSIIGSGINPGNPEKAVEMKQYRNNILIHSGLMVFWDNNQAAATSSPSGGPTKGFGRRTMIDGSWGTASSVGDFQVGDIITTEEQEKTVNHFNSMPKNGWYVSNIETDKQEGSLPEFIEKEGKWFNYIRGIDSDVDSTTDFGAFDIQGIGIVDSMSGNEIVFTNNINSSLQIGDVLYSERPSEHLENTIVDMDENTTVQTGFTIVSSDTVSWDGQAASTRSYIRNVMRDEDIVAGKNYRLELEVSNYTGTGTVGVREEGGVSDSAVMSSDGYYTEDFVSTDGSRLDLFGRPANVADIKLTVREVVLGKVFGFSRLESDQIQKCGVVTSLTNNIVTIDDSGTLPSARDYIMFAKNQSVNTSSLLGYYADATFKNNSTDKVELFSVNSEITESSK